MLDTFPRDGRWGSVGFGCHSCEHLVGPQEWPDAERIIRCSWHGVSLAVVLAPSGYMEGEWFCSEFSDRGASVPNAVKHFYALRSQLSGDILYEFRSAPEPLGEVSLEGLPFAAV